MDPSGPGLRRGAGVAEVLAHFGVKGMRWGVVRKSSSSGPTSTDAKKATVIRTTVKKSGTKAVSNKDLQAAITRMNLERQYKALAPTRGQQVTGFIGKTLLGIGKQEATKLAADVTAKQVASLLKK
jgi:hypothetical protein